MTSTVPAVRERPILFSGPMVRAILDGTKTQTRRVVKHKHGYETHHEKCGEDEARSIDNGPFRCPAEDEALAREWLTSHCPYGAPGDRLYVKETFMRCGCGRCDAVWPNPTPHGVTYRESPQWRTDYAARPSIFLPRWASRITLEIIDVRVQRVQEISEADAQAEGVECTQCTGQNWREVGGESVQCDHPLCGDGRGLFRVLWNELNAKRGFGWDQNPWVWALTFKAIP